MSLKLLYRSNAAARCSSVPWLRWQVADHLCSDCSSDADRSRQSLSDFDYGYGGFEVG